MSVELYPGIPFSPQAALADNVGAADTIIRVTDISAFPDAPNLATIGTDEMGETVLYAAKTADALSGCVRGVEGTAKVWSAGEAIGRNFTAKDHADLIAAVLAARSAAAAAQGAAEEAVRGLADHEGDSDAHADIREAVDDKQPLLTGQPGQVVGFDADGAAVAQDAPDQADAVTVPGGGAMELGPELGDGPYTFEFTPEEEPSISAAQVSYDGAQSGLQAETVQGAIDGLGARTARISNPNLLDNWYLMDPINQRGKTEYTDFGYTIDRWWYHTNSAEAPLRVDSDGISFFCPEESAGSYIDQFLERYDCYRGRTLTFSVLGKFTGRCRLMIYAEINGSWNPPVADLAFDGDGEPSLRTLTFQVPDEAMEHFKVRVTVESGASVTPKAAKLELGPVQTLARQEGDTWVLNGPPPNQALELLKCQRYYQVFATSGLRPSKAEDFRPPMRIKPAPGTININGATYYTADANL